MRFPSLATTLIVITLAPAVLHAQAPTVVAAKPTPPERRTVVTLNPFLIVAGYLTGDIEHKIAPAVTIGAGGSLTGRENFDGYRAFDAKLRFYPNERALQGFSVAATLGVVTSQNDNYSGTGGTTTRRSTRASFGTDLSYQWLLGPRHRFATVTGFGFKRLLGNSSDGQYLDLEYLPTARVSIGMAF